MTAHGWQGRAPDLLWGQQGQPPAGSPPQVAWTADELMATEFAEPRWAVPGIMPEGVVLLAGAPKVGKSWLSLGLAVAVATGEKALGRVDVEAGDVLYLALEDTPRRLKNRLGKVLQGRAAPDSLWLVTSCPALPEGGADRIAGWLHTHPDARMVILDVFAKMRGNPPAGASAYDADYAAVGKAKALADEYGVALVLVHHLRKASSEDYLSEVSGTNGIAGAADTVAVLKRSRGEADAVLHVTGRDVDEADHALTFVPDLGAWHLLDGPALEHTLSDTRAAILRHVRANEGASPREIATAADLDYELTRKTCRRMVDDSQLDTDGRGHYFPPPGTVPAVPAVPVAGQDLDGLSLAVPATVPGVPAGTDDRP